MESWAFSLPLFSILQINFMILDLLVRLEFEELQNLQASFIPLRKFLMQRVLLWRVWVEQDLIKMKREIEVFLKLGLKMDWLLDLA